MHIGGIQMRKRTLEPTLRTMFYPLIALAITAVALLSLGAISAHSATGKAGVTVKGAGAQKAGREVKASLVYTNTSVNPALAPERVTRIQVTSRTLKWNSRARGVPRCGASIPNNGAAPRCSSKSKIGSGRVSGIFGQPGQDRNLLGVLAPVSGTITLYNYRPARGNQARFLAVIRTRTPLVGVSINVLVPVSRGGTITIDVPDVAQMPPAIVAALPAGSRFVMTSLSTSITAKKQRRGRPYAYLRTLKRLDVRVTADYE